MIPLNLLTEIPTTIAQQITPTIFPALTRLAAAAVPAASTAWIAVANSVAQNWTDPAGNGAAGVSLNRAAGAAADLENRAHTIDGDIESGLAAIVSAAVDLSRITVDFLAAAARSLSSLSVGPAGVASAAAGLITAAIGALTQSVERLHKLEEELAPLAKSLLRQATQTVDTPSPPSSADLNPAEVSDSLGDPTNGGPTAAAVQAPDSGATDTDNPTDVAEDNSIASAQPTDAGDDAPTPEARAAVRAALSAVGTPYGWGGNTPGQALDCSGLTHWAYGQAGVDIPRTAEAQAVGKQVSQEELLPGDLAVWSGHVAMVIGDGKMVEAGDPVQVNPIRTTNIGMPFKGFYRPTA